MMSDELWLFGCEVRGRLSPACYLPTNRDASLNTVLMADRYSPTLTAIPRLATSGM
jgi:hypothetical protein